MSSDHNRINNLCESLLRSLGQGYAVDRVEKGNFAFAISRRGTAAQPNPSGRVWEHIGGITYRELQMIVTAYPKDSDAREKIRRRIFLNEDPNPFVAQTPPEDKRRETEEEIQRRVAAEVKRQLQEIAATMRKDETPPKPVVSKKKSKRDAPKDTEGLEVWKQRADILGVKHPNPHPSDPTCADGRWLRIYAPMWKERSEAEQST